MKTTLSIFLFIIVLSSCENIKKTVRKYYKYEMYIDYKNISYQGKNKTQSIYLEIDSVNGIWYNGKLILNNTDTYAIKGFEKGSHYVSTYKSLGTDKNGSIAIWSRGETGKIRDSLTIVDRNLISGIIKVITVLYRQPRTICH